MSATFKVVQKIRVLGIDPGSRQTGYGIVDVVGGKIQHVTHGTFKLSSTSGKTTIPLEQRLLTLYRELTDVIETFRPEVMSLERVFFAKNALSALKLGQARGAAMLTGAVHGLDVVEYSATEAKAMVVGHGQASKEQVAKMLDLLFGKQNFITSDASDGLALAVCHARALGSQTDFNKNLQNTLTKKTSKKKMSLADAMGITVDQARGKKRISAIEK